jgi:hypothetical protein
MDYEIDLDAKDWIESAIEKESVCCAFSFLVASS